MVELFSLICIGIALSMDTFSLSLSIGTLSTDNKKNLKVSIIVGIMHFIMPLLGIIIGSHIIKFIPLNPHYFVSIILFIIALMMLKDLNNENSQSLGLKFIEIFLFALSVSFDAFTTGIGLFAITNHFFLAGIIFTICSFNFTYLGLTIGKYSKSRLGKKASIAGIIILIFVAIMHLIY